MNVNGQDDILSKKAVLEELNAEALKLASSPEAAKDFKIAVELLRQNKIPITVSLLQDTLKEIKTRHGIGGHKK